jgi:hypothetical protein
MMFTDLHGTIMESIWKAATWKLATGYGQDDRS